MKTMFLIRFAQAEVAIQGSSEKKLKVILNVGKVAKKRLKIIFLSMYTLYS